MNFDKTFIYKGYTGSGCYNNDDSVFHGKITNIECLVTYETNTQQALEIEFIKAVDDYILDKTIPEDI